MIADAQAALKSGRVVELTVKPCELMPEGFKTRGYIVHVGHDVIHFEDECQRHHLYAQKIDEVVDIKYV